MTGSRRGVLCTLFLLAVTALIAGATCGLSRVAGLVPAFVLVPALALLILELSFELAPVSTRWLQNALRGVAPGARREPAEAALAVFPGRAFLLPLTFVASILLLGLAWGPPLVTLVYLRGVEEETWPRSVALAIVLLAFSLVVIEGALGVSLFEGALVLWSGKLLGS